MIPEKDREKITVDAASAGEVKIHKIVADDMDAPTKKILGSNAVYFAIRDDAILVGLGADGLAAIKEAATATGGPSAGLLNVAVSASRLAGMVPDDGGKAAKAAKEVFGGNPNGADLITISAQMNQGLKLKVNVKGKVISFGAKAAGIDVGDK